MDQQSSKEVESPPNSKFVTGSIKPTSIPQENIKIEPTIMSGNFNNTSRMDDIDEKDTASIQQSLQRDLDEKNSQIYNLEQILKMEAQEKQQLSSELQDTKEISKVQADQIADLLKKVKSLENELKQQKDECSDLIQKANQAAADCIKAYNEIVEEADDMLTKGEFECAIKKFQEALVIQKVAQDNKEECAYLLNQIAVCYMSSDKTNKALETIEIAIQLDKDRVETLLNRGIVYLTKNDHEKARKDFEAVCRMDPDHEDAKHMLAALKKK